MICTARYKSNFYLKRFAPFQQQIPAGETNNTITVPFPENRHITHIVCAFLVNAASPFKSSPTDFHKGFSIAGNVEAMNTNDPMSLLKTISVTIGGVTLPQAQYNLQNQLSSAGVITSNTNDLQKAYTDIVALTDNMRDRAGWCLNFDEWLNTQIYMFKVPKGMSNKNNTAYITVNASATVGIAATLQILPLFDEWIEFSYNDFAELQDMKIMNNVEDIA